MENYVTFDHDTDRGRGIQIVYNPHETFQKGTNDRYFSFILIKKGIAECLLDGQIRFFCAPTFLCLNEKQTLSLRSSSKCEAISLYFQPTFINRNMTYGQIYSKNYEDISDVHALFQLRPFLENEYQHTRITGFPAEAADKAALLFESCGYQLRAQPDWYWSCRARSHFMDLLHLLERLYYAHGDMPGSTPFDISIPAEKTYLSPVLQHIWENYDDPGLNASTLVQRFTLNKNKLYKDFKEITGKGVYEYILEYRLYAADSKLRFTELTVDEIALSCGFSSTSNFSYIFKQKMGVPPKEFRKMAFEKRVKAFQAPIPDRIT